MKKQTIVFTVLLIVIAALCGYYFFKEYRMARDEAAYYSSLQGKHTVTVSDDGTRTGDAESANGDEPPGLPYVEIDFDELLAQNPETVGYIHMPYEDSPISFPVLQASDNTKYLCTSFSGESMRSGAVFIDCLSDIEMPDQNVVIYAHNMGNGRTKEMFGSLIFFKDEEYVAAHRYIQFNRVKDVGPQWWRIFAVVPYSMDNTDFNYLKLTFSDQNEFLEWAAKAKELSLYESDVEIKANDRVITLSTCDATLGKGARLLVMAVKVDQAGFLNPGPA